MRTRGIVLVLVVVGATSLFAQERSAADSVFAAALYNVRQELQGAPPMNMQHLPTEAIVVARRTIGGAPIGYRAFVDKYFGSVIAEELQQSYGDNGPAPRTIDARTAGGFAVLPLEQFESGAFGYDWERLNQKYPQVRYVVRLSWPAVDRLGTYGVVRYELIGRDRPSTWRSPWTFQHGSFVRFEKQTDGSWKRTNSVTGAIWN